MNELNLQNPDFRERIYAIRVDRDKITVGFFVRDIYFNFRTGIIICYGSLLSNNQRWFSRRGDEIITLNDLERLGYRIPKNENS